MRSALLRLPPCIRSLAAQQIWSSATSRALTRHDLSTSAAQPQSEPTPAAHVNSSVNHDEVAHFKTLASSWWDPHGSSRLLHLMNPHRHDFIDRCLKGNSDSERRNLRYLDVGCGGGIFAESAARRAHTASVTAIDPTPDVIAVARRHQRQDPKLLEPGRLTYKNVPIEDLPPTEDGATEQFDVVTLFEVIEHIQKPSPFLQDCLRHLKPGGWLIGSTIARTNTSWFTTKFVAEDVLHLVPRGTHDWSQYVQPSELQQWAQAQPNVKADWQGWKVMGVVYVPGLGWKEVTGSESWGNYFFGMQKRHIDK